LAALGAEMNARWLVMVQKLSYRALQLEHAKICGKEAIQKGDRVRVVGYPDKWILTHWTGLNPHVHQIFAFLADVQVRGYTFA